MTNLKSYTYKLYPSKIQKIKINATILAAKFVYNKLLSIRIIQFCTYKSYINKCDKLGINPDICKIKKYSKMPKFSSINEKYSITKNVDKLALLSEWSNVNKAFNNYYNNKCEFPKFNLYINSYSTININNNINILGDKIYLPKIGLVKINIFNKFPINCIIQKCIIKGDKYENYNLKIFTINKEMKFKKCI